MQRAVQLARCDRAVDRCDLDIELGVERRVASAATPSRNHVTQAKPRKQDKRQDKEKQRKAQTEIALRTLQNRPK